LSLLRPSRPRPVEAADVDLTLPASPFSSQIRLFRLVQTITNALGPLGQAEQRRAGPGYNWPVSIMGRIWVKKNVISKAAMMRPVPHRHPVIDDDAVIAPDPSDVISDPRTDASGPVVRSLMFLIGAQLARGAPARSRDLAGKAAGLGSAVAGAIWLNPTRRSSPSTMKQLGPLAGRGNVAIHQLPGSASFFVAVPCAGSLFLKRAAKPFRRAQHHENQGSRPADFRPPRPPTSCRRWSRTVNFRTRSRKLPPVASPGLGFGPRNSGLA